MGDTHETDSNNISQAIQILCREKTPPSANQIFLSPEPEVPIVLIRDLRLYYSPSDICNYAFSLKELCSHSLLLVSATSPSFVLLQKTSTIEAAKALMSEVKKHPNPICSMDSFEFDYVHSVSFQSPSLSHLYCSFMSLSLEDINCAICLNPCNSEFMLFSLPCAHTLHTRCMIKMSQWECPICRYTPISSLDVACCEICNSFDRPFVCLCCARSFCHEHCHQHYKHTGHAYCASADGRETWNLMSGSSMKRLAVDKSGEFVEMCAKDDMLRNYLEAALEEQIAIHKSLSMQQLKHENDMIESEKKRLANLIQERKRKIEEKEKLIEAKEMKEKRLKYATQILQNLKTRLTVLPSENSQLEIENEKLEKQVEEQSELIKDMEGTCCITAAAVLKGKNEEVHVKFNNNNTSQNRATSTHTATTPAPPPRRKKK
ncbi:hypothetical protein TRFO_05131 [Tritrichomonas foetus]|uniref:RING-type domain-containing protein n=1 Tax=Tritrichomonas foetus TaxID=1144522 RepID=A0A1J4KCT8_9EUKA|nr:hypothetical protein TRFO_05131 [Tritrichomonas foetus]|eukprot:OHT07516.1 hypothetical protein TRFO_05131 [Tritrichomonas foetus]